MAIGSYEARCDFSGAQMPAFRDLSGQLLRQESIMKHYAGDRTIDGVKGAKT